MKVFSQKVVMKKVLFLFSFVLVFSHASTGNAEEYQSYPTSCGDNGICVEMVNVPGVMRAYKRFFRVNRYGKEIESVSGQKNIEKWLKKPKLAEKISRIAENIEAQHQER